MSSRILAIGNALVDIIAHMDPNDIAQLNLTPGGMTLVDGPTSRKIHEMTRDAREISGGSAANTAAIAASLGAKTSYAGKVAPDKLGQIFIDDLAAQGIEILTSPTDASANLHTGTCLSLITPDGQRTMCTHLGAAQTLSAADLKSHYKRNADIIFLEGYLLDAPGGYDIFRLAISSFPDILSVTLSDARCVARHAAFLHEIIEYIDLLFGNEEEMIALFPEAQAPQEAATIAATHVDRVVCTHGPNGVYIAEDGQITHLPAHKVKVVDTTGAGDSLAGTILWALAYGYDLQTGAEMAIRVAGEVISAIGARPTCDIREMLEEEGFFELT